MFPTWYRANTKKDLARLAENAGFSGENIRTIEERPEYLRMNFLTYLGGIIYERLVNKVSWLAPFRVILVGEWRRPG